MDTEFIAIQNIYLLSEYTLNKLTRRCYKFVSELKSWNDSFYNCLKDGAYPATVYTVEKALAIKTIYEKKVLQTKTNVNVHFIGFIYTEDVGTWITVFGKEFSERISYEQYSLKFSPNGKNN